MAPIQTRDLLLQIGFKEGPMAPFSHKPVLIFDFGNFKLTGTQLMNKHFAQVFLFTGNNISERRTTQYSFELPIEVESYELGLAYLSFNLGTRFTASFIPDWYNEGLKFQKHLPWKKEAEAFDHKLSANIEGDYYKLIVKRLIKLSAECSEDDITTISFDGEIVTIFCSGEKLLAPATGKAWNELVSLKTRSLSKLSKRIPNQSGTISFLKNLIFIGNRPFTPLPKAT